MGIVIRQSIKSTIVSYIGVLIGTFNILYVFPKFLLPEEIGLIRLFQDIPLLIASIVQLGAVNITNKFYTYFRNNDNQDRGFLFFILGYPLVGFILFFSFFYLFYDYWTSFYIDSSPLLVRFFYILVPLVFFLIYIGILEAYARVNFRIVVPSFIKEFLIRILISLVVFLYAYQLISLEEFVWFFVAIYLAGLIFFIIYLLKLGRFNLKPDLTIFSKVSIKEMFFYLAFIFPGVVGTLIAGKIDTLMVAAYINLENTGIFSVAFFLGTVVEIPKRALTSILIPIISSAWKDNNLKQINEIYKKSVINQSLIGIWIFTMIWLNIDSLFALLPNSDIYIQGKYVVLFIGLARVLDLMTGVNGEILLFSNYYKLNLLFVSLYAALVVISNIIFIPEYGITGAAFATFLSISINNIGKYIFLKSTYGFEPYNSRFFILIIVTAVLFIGDLFISVDYDNWFQVILVIVLKCTVISIVFFASTVFFRISDEFIDFIKRILKFFRK